MAANSAGLKTGTPVVVPVIGGWESFTPTGSWVTNTSYTGSKRRVGSTAEYIVRIALTGAPNAVALTIDIPDGSADSSVLNVGGNDLILGIGSYVDAGTNEFSAGIRVAYDSATAVRVHDSASGNFFSNTVPIVWANGDIITLRYSVPIVGWPAVVASGAGAATTTLSGLVTPNTQTFGGNKTFNGTVSLGAVSGTVGPHTGYITAADVYSATAFQTQVLELRNFKTGAAGNTCQLMFRTTTGDATASAWSIGNVALGGSNASDFVFKTQNGTSATIEVMRVNTLGATTFNQIHNVGAGNITSGRYTPTITNGANIASSVSQSCHYSRVGNIVTVSGVVQVATTAAALTLSEFSLSLPIASNLTTGFDVGGSATRQAASGTAMMPIILSADPTNDRAIFDFNSTQTANSIVTFTFQYEVK